MPPGGLFGARIPISHSIYHYRYVLFTLILVKLFNNEAVRFAFPMESSGGSAAYMGLSASTCCHASNMTSHLLHCILRFRPNKRCHETGEC